MVAEFAGGEADPDRSGVFNPAARGYSVSATGPDPPTRASKEHEACATNTAKKDAPGPAWWSRSKTAWRERVTRAWTSAGVPLLVGVAVFVVHCRGTMGCADSMWSVPTAVSLVDHGDANLDEYLPVVHARHELFTEWHRGHVYTMFPLGTSLLVSPAIPVLRLIARAAVGEDAGRFRALEEWQQRTGCPTVAGEPIVSLHSIAELILASAIVALTAVVMCAVGSAEGLSTTGAATIAVIFAFGTSAWSTASRSLWQHGPSMLVLSLALLLQVRRRWAPATGALLAFGYVIRPTNAIALAAGAAWAGLGPRRRFAGFAVASAAVLAAFVLANRSIYGAVLPPYFRPQRIGASGTFLEALAADVISPARGLLVFSPVLAFAALGIALKARDRALTVLDGSLVASILLHWVAIASFPHWWGGYSVRAAFLHRHAAVPDVFPDPGRGLACHHDAPQTCDGRPAVLGRGGVQRLRARRRRAGVQRDDLERRSGVGGRASRARVGLAGSAVPRWRQASMSVSGEARHSRRGAYTPDTAVGAAWPEAPRRGHRNQRQPRSCAR